MMAGGTSRVVISPSLLHRQVPDLLSIVECYSSVSIRDKLRLLQRLEKLYQA